MKKIIVALVLISSSMHAMQKDGKDLLLKESLGLQQASPSKRDLVKEVERLKNLTTAQCEILRCKCENQSSIRQIGNVEVEIAELKKRINKLEAQQQNSIGLSLVAAMSLLFGRCC